MLKHLIAIIILATLVVFGKPYVHTALNALVTGHDYVVEALKEVFSGGKTGNILKQVIAALALPMLIAFIPALFYWFAKRQLLPSYMLLVWVFWLVQTSALIMVDKTPAATSATAVTAA